VVAGGGWSISTKVPRGARVGVRRHLGRPALPLAMSGRRRSVDHCDDRAILLESGEGPARFKTTMLLRHGEAPSVAVEQRGAIPVMGETDPTALLEIMSALGENFRMPKSQLNRIAALLTGPAQWALYPAPHIARPNPRVCIAFHRGRP
jgi:hypothetical protein